MAKIKMKHSVTVADTFADFLTGKKAAGVSEKTLATYGQHFSAISKHLSPTIPIDGLNKADLEAMIASMRDAGLAANSIKSYTRTLKTFLSWCCKSSCPRLSGAQKLDKISETPVFSRLSDFVPNNNIIVNAAHDTSCFHIKNSFFLLSAMSVWQKIVCTIFPS